MKTKPGKRLLSAALALAAAIGMMMAGAPAAYAKASLESTLNSVKLTPISTGNSKYDAKLQAITGTGSTYERVRRGYTWLAENLIYQKNSPMDNTGNYWLDMAYGPLFANRGSCKNFSAATYYMLRYIGLPGVQRIAGYIINSTGKIQYHNWNVVILNGTSYIVDAEIEGKMYARKGRTGGLPYSLFFRNAMSIRYSPRYVPMGVTIEKSAQLAQKALEALGD